jgi:hypothetical protein
MVPTSSFQTRPGFHTSEESSRLLPFKHTRGGFQTSPVQTYQRRVPDFSHSNILEEGSRPFTCMFIVCSIVHTYQSRVPDLFCSYILEEGRLSCHTREGSQTSSALCQELGSTTLLSSYYTAGLQACSLQSRNPALFC